MKTRRLENAKADILVVDDTPANLQLLNEMLTRFGFVVRPALSGELALQAARRQQPDIILLDARMPNMDGIEVCQQLKLDSKLKDIPVIFISAHNQIQDKVQAFEAGAVDYITKPFEVEEVRSRILIRLELDRSQKQTQKKNTFLEKQVNLQTLELIESNKKLAQLDQAKTEFLSAISHELRTPLNGLLGAGELMLAEGGGSPQMWELQNIFEESRQRILMFIDDALLLSDMRVKGSLFAENASRLAEVLNTVVRGVEEKARKTDVKISAAYAADLGSVLGDWFFLERAIVRLLETALKFTRRGGFIQLRAVPAINEVYLIIETGGSSVPEKDLPRFFDVLSVGKTLAAGADLGLSPAVAAQIIKLLGGKVTVANIQSGGIKLTASLPRSKSVVESNQHQAASQFNVSGTDSGSLFPIPVKPTA